jgi:hypothetical protein
MMVLRKLGKVVLVKHGMPKNVVGYGKRYPIGVLRSSVEAWSAIGGADTVGGHEGGNSDKRVSRHQKLYRTRQSV